jgi:hypothetical protein
VEQEITVKDLYEIDITGAEFQKFCGTNNPEGDGCVEVAAFEGGILLRDSKRPEAAPHRFTPDEMTAFVKGYARENDITL